MKSLKKVLALVLTCAMVLSMAVVAFALESDEDGYKITITDAKDNHTYEAYQIFSGTLSTDEAGKKTLSDVKWGEGVTLDPDAKLELTAIGEGEHTAAEWAELLEEGTVTAAQFADAISAYLATDATGTSTENTSPYTITGLEAGYYLVKDQKDSLNNATNDAYTSFILKVVGDAEANPKSYIPDVGKEVLDNNDSDKNDETNKWGTTADHDIGDHVSFRLTGTLPQNYDDYSTYKYVFHDKMEKGLTYDNNAVVYVEINGVKHKLEVTPTWNPETGELTIAFDDLKSASLEAFGEGADEHDPCDCEITATSKIIVEYTATLNENAVIGNPGNHNEVYLEYSNDPNWDGNGEEPTGKTEEKKVVVFTYDVVVNKTDENGDPLKGAEFTLEKFVEGEGTDEYDGKTGTWTTVKVVKNEAGTSFEFKGLDDGYYRLRETQAPAGYNKLAEDLYFEVKAEHGDTVTDLSAEDKNEGEEDKIEFTLVTKTEENNEPDHGKLSTDIKNYKGVQLPETGGIGTTIFYVVGSLLVIFAGVLLITKRRMKAED